MATMEPRQARQPKVLNGSSVLSGLISLVLSVVIIRVGVAGPA
jgi:hypothetical protein